MFYNGSVQAVDAFAFNYHRRVLFISRLEPDFIVRLKKGSLKGRFVRHYKTYETIVAIMYLGISRASVTQVLKRLIN